MSTDAERASGFSPVDNEPPLRWWRRLRVVGAREIGAGRRAVLVALVAWLPIAVWAYFADRFLRADPGEPLLHHYGVHVRCLVAIPLFILGEAALHRAGKAIAGLFVATGALPPERRPAFDAAIRDVARLRDAWLPWVLVLGAAVAVTLVDSPRAPDDALNWALDADGGVGFGGWWFLYIVRPIFLALLLGWVWRIALVTYLMWRIGRLGLSLVPTHPDRAGGIAFVEWLPGAFALVTLSLSAVLASRWAHDVLHHGASLASFRVPALAYAVLWTLVLLLPLFALAPALSAVRRKVLPAYSALVGEHGRLVHRRWIEREPIADASVLEAAEIGPVADAAVLYHAARGMRSVPVGKVALAAIIVPMVVPFVLLVAVEFPIREILGRLVKVLL